MCGWRVGVGGGKGCEEVWLKGGEEGRGVRRCGWRVGVGGGKGCEEVRLEGGSRRREGM